MKRADLGGDPGAFCADLHRGDGAEFGECACHGGVVVTQSVEGGSFFFVGEDDVDRIAEDFPEGIARGLDDFEGGEIQADGATGFFGSGEDGAQEGFVEEEIALDVRMLTTGEIVRVDFIGLECHGGAEIGAHGALAVRGDKREAVPVWRRADLEAAAVAAQFSEARSIELPVCTVAGLTEEGSRSTEASECKESIAGGATGERVIARGCAR